MRDHHLFRSAAQTSTVIHLLAHARLCEQIAQVCPNAVTAERLKSMARECAGAAAQIKAGYGLPVATRH
jgi:hypothetical protein